MQNDSKEFENITKKYREQLIKVKASVFISCCSAFHSFDTVRQMSDMANNDLEKYAKALDKYVDFCHLNACSCVLRYISAIMKYHSLKMEEVNDTMKHLWNKTYQGTGVCQTIHSGFLTGFHLPPEQILMVSKSPRTTKVVPRNDRTTIAYVLCGCAKGRSRLTLNSFRWS